MLKKHIHILLITIFIGSLLASCEKVVHLDLNSAETRIVIEGNITPNPGPYEVVIRTSGDYYTAEGIMPITGAKVIVSDDLGNSDTLSEESEGVYFTNTIVGESYRTYSLEVKYKDISYSGTELLPAKVFIDSLSYEEMPVGAGPPPEDEDKKMYIVFCNFLDPVETEDYYRFKIKINNESVESRGSSYILANDQLFNGQYVKYTIWGVEASPQDTVSIILETIGFNTFEYFRTLNDALSSGGMGSTPYNPISNLTNDALGYFGAYTSDKQSIILKREASF